MVSDTTAARVSDKRPQKRVTGGIRLDDQALVWRALGCGGPIIMLTSRSMRSSKEQCVEPVGEDLCTRPSCGNELMIKVDHFVARPAYAEGLDVKL